ncbi:hypothetical protein HOLDEFILI_01923 [Holdemania filiformis DSM 12042]|uniref:Uncharacterized protein n=1 Tax=Holdemania filiformis DSM 12042 TaxID=545696 RepID=B9Y7X7_9FIRM|nr:hypothetical protein HOLDEFILI_01923 [Holdemania filiformis DSM 12042]
MVFQFEWILIRRNRKETLLFLKIPILFCVFLHKTQILIYEEQS